MCHISISITRPRGTEGSQACTFLLTILWKNSTYFKGNCPMFSLKKSSEIPLIFLEFIHSFQWIGARVNILIL